MVANGQHGTKCKIAGPLRALIECTGVAPRNHKTRKCPVTWGMDRGGIRIWIFKENLFNFVCLPRKHEKSPPAPP